MKIDYKILGVEDDGKRTVAKIRIYTGDETTEDEVVDRFTRKTGPVKRYRRSKLIGERVIALDVSGLTTDELEEHLNKTLAEVADAENLTPIEQQKVTDTEASTEGTAPNDANAKIL